MRLSDVRQAYDYFSGKASDLSRQLAFAGIAVVWVFRRDTAAGLAIPPSLVRPALFFCAALACDLLHYVAATLAWGTFHRLNELKLKKPGDDPVLTAPRFINWPQTLFFALKLTSVAIGYAFLLRFLLRELPA
jgi:hypothetical protein